MVLGAAFTLEWDRARQRGAIDQLMCVLPQRAGGVVDGTATHAARTLRRDKPLVLGVRAQTYRRSALGMAVLKP